MNSGTRITECEKSYYLDSYLTVHAKALHIRLFSTPWTVALQAPLSMGFSTQEYWSEESYSRGSSQLKERTHISMSLTLAGIFFTTSAT